MRLTQVLGGPPVFRFWKDFGAGRQRRQPNFKRWRYARIAHFERMAIPDHTLPAEKLPPGARVLEAEDLLQGHIDAMPDEIISKKNANKIVYDHPWPYNVQLDPLKNQDPIYCYSIQTRFFTPKNDCQVLTNTLIEADYLEAHPPLEPTGQDIEYLHRHFDWATRADSVLIRKPKKHQWPKINIRPTAAYGIVKERTETNILNTMSAYSQTLLTKYYAEQNNQEKFNEILSHRSLAFPHCVVPFERETNGKRKLIHLDLFIDSMMIGKKSLPQINAKPEDTRKHEPLDFRPRTWRSILEQTRQYSPSWSFTLPRDAHLHTIFLASRINRDHRDSDEMLARSIIHAFGLTSQYARLQAVTDSEAEGQEGRGPPKSISTQVSHILQDPLSVRQVNSSDLLEQPIVLQTISYDHAVGTFLFLRYQLNTLNFDDQNPSRVKNQAWHSGPISELDQALRYFLDFQTFDPSMLTRMLSDLAKGPPTVEETNDGSPKQQSPEILAEGY